MNRFSTSFILLLLATTYGATQAAHLRGNAAIIHDESENVVHEDFMECFVTQDDGIAPPGTPELIPKLSCHIEQTDEHAEASYDIVGNTDAFFAGLDISSGNIVLRFHTSLIRDSSILEIEEKSMDKVTIVHDRRRKLVSSNGQVKVLVVRISDDMGMDPRRKISQSTTQMYWDVFGDENNLARVYQRCSNGKLQIVPATGTDPKTGQQINQGVVTVVPSASEDICSMNYKTAANIALNALRNASIDAQLKMFILPDCVDFQGAGAWGQTPGQITWFPSRYASYPITQVHEVGHNFGMRHSGKNGVSYADDTDGMGNKGIWSDIGSQMCFNGAKTWYFGWYSEYHKYVNPENWAFKGDLAPVTDVARFTSSHDMVLQLKSGTQAVLFVIFNRAEAFNKDVGDPDSVVITQQYYSFSESTWKASLKAGETYTQPNWNGSLNTLVVKNCGITLSDQSADMNAVDVATVIAYVDGVTSASCPEETGQQNNFQNDGPQTSVETACQDTPNWYDMGGRDFTCAWYAQDPSYCSRYGNYFANFGETANSACCVCKNALN